jgi:hypothetical protein
MKLINPIFMFNHVSIKFHLNFNVRNILQSNLEELSSLIITEYKLIYPTVTFVKIIINPLIILYF